MKESEGEAVTLVARQRRKRQAMQAGRQAMHFADTGAAYCGPAHQAKAGCNNQSLAAQLAAEAGCCRCEWGVRRPSQRNALTGIGTTTRPSLRFMPPAPHTSSGMFCLFTRSMSHTKKLGQERPTHRTEQGHARHLQFCQATPARCTLPAAMAAWHDDTM